MSRAAVSEPWPIARKPCGSAVQEYQLLGQEGGLTLRHEATPSDMTVVIPGSR